MTTSRAILLLVALAVASASFLAFDSRAPAEVRNAEPDAGATDPDRGASFTDADVARHGAYRAPAYLAVALTIMVQVVALVVLATVLVPNLIARLGDLPGGWVTQVALVAALVVGVVTLVTLPMSYVRGFQMEHAWGLSTQTAGGWIADQLRGVAIALVTSLVPALAFFGLVRLLPRMWWLWGWVVFSLLTVLLTFLWPIVIAPLFNRFTPLEDGPLKQRVVALAGEAGVTLDDVLVADASKRTTAENAYVAGIGSSKRVVLYDTLVAAGDADETAYVVAHELGHEVHDHIWRSVALASASLLAAFGVLRWLARRDEVWAWAGASGIADPRALPLLALFVLVAGLVFLPVQNAVSRSFERAADRVAIDLTHDPDTATRVYRRLAFSNLADLRPPRIAVWALFSHPPIPERIGNVLDARPND